MMRLSGIIDGKKEISVLPLSFSATKKEGKPPEQGRKDEQDN
jgi:hypothetical protein